MSFLKGLGIGGGGEAGGGGNFLANLLGTSPENMQSIAGRIGMGANQIAQAGGAQAGYQPNGYAPMPQAGDPNNFFMKLFGSKSPKPTGNLSPEWFAGAMGDQGRPAPNLSLYSSAVNKDFRL